MRSPFREYPCLGRADAGHISDSVHIGEARLRVLRTHRDPAVLGHAARRYNIRHAVLGNAQEQVDRAVSAPIVQNGDAACGVEGADQPVGDVYNAALSERRQQRPGCCRRRRDWQTERHHQADRTSLRTPRPVRWSCSNNAASLGAGGHLNGVDVTPTMAWPFEKLGITSLRRSAPAKDENSLPLSTSPGVAEAS